jgi:hypothetical protein
MGKGATHHAHSFLQYSARISHPVLGISVFIGSEYGGHDENVGHEMSKQAEEK